MQHAQQGRQHKQQICSDFGLACNRALRYQRVCSAGLHANTGGWQGLPATLWTVVEWKTQKTFTLEAFTSESLLECPREAGRDALNIVIVCVILKTTAKRAVGHVQAKAWEFGVTLCFYHVLQNCGLRGTAMVMCNREKCCRCVAMQNKGHQIEAKG